MAYVAMQHQCTHVGSRFKLLHSAATLSGGSSVGRPSCTTTTIMPALRADVACRTVFNWFSMRIHEAGSPSTSDLCRAYVKINTLMQSGHVWQPNTAVRLWLQQAIRAYTLGHACCNMMHHVATSTNLRTKARATAARRCRCFSIQSACSSCIHPSDVGARSACWLQLCNDDNEQ